MTQGVTQLEFAQICLDLSAVFILVGMMYFTSLYRRPHKLSDRLFQYMLFMDMAIGIIDAINYFLDGRPFPKVAELNMFINTLFYLCFEAVPLCLALYLYAQIREDKELRLIKKRLPIIVLPCVLSMIMVIANQFMDFLFTVDLQYGYIVRAPLFPLIYIGAAIYFVWSFFMFMQMNVVLAVMFVVLLVSRVWLGLLLSDVSSTALLYSVLFVYIHVQRMNKAYYETREDVV